MMASPLLQADWLAPPGVRALSTLRRGEGVGISAAPFDDFNLGDRCGDDPTAVAANRRALHDMLALPSSPHWLRQVHGTAVYVANPTLPCSSAARRDAAGTVVAAPTEAPPNAIPEADAAVTRQVGEVLAILAADCLPVLFCADDGSEIAAAHAGWRGLAGGVLEATLAAMHTRPADVAAWLGPAAGPGAYEVGAEVRDAFVSANPEAAAAFAPTRPGHWRCDLYQLARLRLRWAGVHSVHGGQHCTISDPRRFFSHRRDGLSGRMASLIWIEPASA